MIDNHVHTSISHDGKSTMDDYLKIAKEKGVDKIVFTEHWDDYEGLTTNLKTLDVDDYYHKYQKVINNPFVLTSFGIEIGLQPDIKFKVEEVVKKYPFDFIIGSSHITCKKDMSMDKSFFEGLTRKEAYLKYFNEVLENIKIYDEFDVYGHLDYVVRYGGYAEKVISYLEFREILDEILKAIINKGKGIEINTSGIRYGLNSPHPNIEILKRYKELGGEIITIGSDAHQTCDLASNFDIAYKMLEEVGFEYTTNFVERKPNFQRIRR